MERPGNTLKNSNAYRQISIVFGDVLVCLIKTKFSYLIDNGFLFESIGRIVAPLVPLWQQDTFEGLHLLHETLNPLYITILYL